MIMKELVTAFAACAAAGLALAQVESNIVGYVNTQGANGATVFSPMFVACGGGNATLGDITGDFTEYSDTLQILDETLTTSTMYSWIDVTYSAITPVWTSDGSTDDSAVVIPRGAGVVISSSAAVILNAGEVETTDVVISCDMGATVLGNPTPVTITLGDITFSGLQEWDDSIQLLDPTLSTAEIYTWIDVTYGSNDPVWSSDGVADDSSTILAPGAGFVLSCANNGVTVTFPSAL